METTVSILLDTRRSKSDETYPIKLRVYSPLLQKAKIYSAGVSMTKQQFESVWLTERPRKIHQDDRDFLDEIRINAVNAAKNTDPFSFEVFEKKLRRRKGDGKNVIYHYKQRIKHYLELEQHSTADSYRLSLQSILKYIESQKGSIPNQVSFNSVTPTFLQKYEFYMVKSGKSETTVGIYLRNLRAVFNHAIREGEVSEDLYPFGKRKYEIPQGRAVKKALSKNQIKALWHAKPLTPQQQKAKDFWFFSFICNGINMKDICLLKYENLKGDTIEFKRAKTRQTSKKNITTIVIHLTDYAKSVIEKYGNENREADQYIFPILTESTPPIEVRPIVINFTRIINLHIKLLAKANNLPEEISTYWARHSFATLAIQGGANMEFVKEAFGHQNITTTQNYFAGFEDEAKKSIVENLLNFK
ncbi:tyrosine-type recombinase/integrase [Maribellus sediminis]|uniref:tyrosine-type recombinase/integrase n=1 Tax=Maribellus sediminis TaxID=2696285 RepID=UPI00142F6B7D|nr:site-specific integrase [Maribellus sediminis]